MHLTSRAVYLACLLGAAYGALPAAAHVAPSLATNNRYIKLTALGDRLRLVYTVYMGERPGAAVRRRMDRNQDGTIADSETSDFAGEIAAGVLRGLAITVDGQAHELAWSETHVGLGTPIVAAGAFSIDLIAWLCLDEGRTTHSIHLADRYNVPEPGELELRVEAGPGVTIIRSSVGQAGATPTLHFTWNGRPEVMAEPGYTLELAVDPTAAAPGPPGVCEPAPAVPPESRRALDRLTTLPGAAALALVSMLVLGGTAWWLRRRARAAP